MVWDASGFGLRAVAVHNNRPLGYHFSKMTATERKYVVPEQKLLAMVEALCI